MALAGTKLNSGRKHLRDLACKEKRVCIGFTRLVRADALADSCSYISSLAIFYEPKRLKIVEVLRAAPVVIMELRASFHVLVGSSLQAGMPQFIIRGERAAYLALLVE